MDTTVNGKIPPGIERRSFIERRGIFREEKLGDHAFVVEQGTIEIIKTVGHQQILLGRVTTGGVFNEMALIDGTPWMVSVHRENPLRRQSHTDFQ
jgi:CRP-like cAMP-binding protein